MKKTEIDELKAENQKLEKYKLRDEKASKRGDTAYFDVPLKLEDKEYDELTFRRPKGRDIADVMTISAPAEQVHQLARLLCPELNNVDDEEFYEMDYLNHYKPIGNVIEGFM